MRYGGEKALSYEIKSVDGGSVRRTGRGNEGRRDWSEIHYSGRTGGWTGGEGSTGLGRGRGVPFGRSSFSKTSCLSLVGSSIRFSRCRVPNSADLRAFNSTM